MRKTLVTVTHRTRHNITDVREPTKQNGPRWEARGLDYRNQVTKKKERVTEGTVDVQLSHRAAVINFVFTLAATFCCDCGAQLCCTIA